MDFNKIFKKVAGNYIVKNIVLAVVIVFVVIFITLLSIRIYTDHGESFGVPDFTGLSLSEVDQIAKARHLRYEVVDSVYDNDLPGGAVVEQYPEPNFKVKDNRRIFLTTNAVLPEMTKMPNVVGVTLRQAVAEIETRGLKVGKLTYIPDIATNSVLYQKYQGQQIEPGTEIEKGATIDLVLGKGLSAERTVPPQLIGLSLEDAKQKIVQAYLNLGAVVYDDSVVDQQDSIHALIFKQSPLHTNTNLVNLGSSIDVWLTADSVKLEKIMEKTYPDYDSTKNLSTYTPQ
ncbi:MAG TPA: PASTA domain-containing protein [Bacteroidales bacterium]|nr:PASTA domain-containing protein [Bacteroidales bacterium]